MRHNIDGNSLLAVGGINHKYISRKGIVFRHADIPRCFAAGLLTRRTGRNMQDPSAVSRMEWKNLGIP